MLEKLLEGGKKKVKREEGEVARKEKKIKRIPGEKKRRLGEERGRKKMIIIYFIF